MNIYGLKILQKRNLVKELLFSLILNVNYFTFIGKLSKLSAHDKEKHFKTI